MKELKKYKALEQLKSEIDSQIRNLEETADEKTIEKINRMMYYGYINEIGG